MPWEGQRAARPFDHLARSPRGDNGPGLFGHQQDFLDSLAVMEEGMRHFYVRAITAKQTKEQSPIKIGGADRGEDRAVSACALERREAGR